MFRTLSNFLSDLKFFTIPVTGVRNFTFRDRVASLRLLFLCSKLLYKFYTKLISLLKLSLKLLLKYLDTQNSEKVAFVAFIIRGESSVCVYVTHHFDNKGNTFLLNT